MGTQTELVGREIFVTDKGGGGTVPPPLSSVPPPSETKLPPAMPEQPKKRNIPLIILIVLFLISSVSGLYIIFTGGAGPAAIETPEKPFTKITAPAKAKEGVALIKIRGAISEPQSSSGWGEPSGASSIAKRIRSVADKDNVKAIILDINSPGGTVAAVQDIYNAVIYAREKKNKKVIALMRDIAASGGYYISVACDKIVAQPGTLTGSIGVIFQTSNLEGLLDKVGVKFGAVKSGRLKDMGSSFRPMTEEEKALFQDLIDDSYDQFFGAVKQGRPNIPPEVLKNYADGRVFTGRRALKLGLIDQLGGEEEALKTAGDLTGLKKPEIITVKTNTFIEWFTSSLDAESSNKNIAKQLESAAEPRMAYMWTM
ncbi:MAG: signal peptide peptidase SppA [Elusimicrobium sp.]|jgi:protease-4|nr:signal peptide peptidase SppA [Elusimicrobium sp.]